MAHGTHSLEEMRAHASDVVKKDFVSLPQPERDRLEIEYKTEWLAIRDNASMEANRLRLALYANLLDVNTTADKIDESAWILNNIQATQILINTLSPGALQTIENGVVISTGEDGVIGPRTQDCIKKLFGIDIALSTSDAGDTETTTESLVETAGIASALTLSLRRAMENDPRLKDQLGDMGVELKTEKDPVTGVETEKLVFPEGFENTPEYAQVMKYLDALHLTHSPEFTSENITDVQRRKKLELYLYFAEEGGNFVMDRKYITYKLINSIYQDLLRDPTGPYQIVKDGKDGNYAIVKSPIERDADYKITASVERLPADHPYQKIIENGRTHAAYLNFARTYNLVEQNHQAFAGNEFLGQATLVRTILEKYGITGVSDEHVQDPNLLLADWDIIKEQIDAKLASSNDVRATEELLYVKDLIEGGEWMNEQGNLQVFREINTYGRGFLEEKRLLSDQYSGLEGASGERNIGEMIGSLGWEMLPIGLLSAVLLWITGNGKLGGGVILGLLGAIAGGKLIDGVQERVAPLIDNDSLEIIRIMELRYSIKGVDAPNDVLNKMYDENDTRGETARTSAERQKSLDNPLVLGKVVYEISQNETLKGTRLDSPTLLDEVFSGINTTITGEEFNSNIGGRTHTLTKEEVGIALDIMQAEGVGDEQDIYLGDLLVTGDIDKVYHDYDSAWFAFTESSAFDLGIHNTMRTAWESGDSEARKELLKIMEEFDTNLSTGRVDAAGVALGYSDGLFDSLSSFVGNIGGATSTLALGTSTDDKKQKIGDLKAKIDTSTLDVAVKTSLKELLDGYILLLEKQDEFQAIRSTWYSSEGNTLTYYSMTKWVNGKEETKENYDEIGRDITAKKGELETIKLSLSYPLYGDLMREIENEIEYLEKMEREITGKIIALATGVGDIIDGTGAASEDINTITGIGSVLGVADKLHAGLNDSINDGLTDIFGALNTDFKPALINFYNQAKVSGINGVTATTTLTSDIWVGMQEYLVSQITGLPSITPPNTIPTVSQVAAQPTAIEDLEIQIKLGLIEEYFIKFGPQIEALKKVKAAYEPALDAIVAGGETLTADQQRLKNMLSTDYDTLLQNIETKIDGFAGLYTAGQKMTDIQTLSTNSISDLDKFTDIQGFLSSFTGMDGRISSIKAKADIYLGTSNTISAHLVPTTTLQAAFETKRTELKQYIESDPIVDTTRIESLTVVGNDTTSGTIKGDIAILSKVQSIIGSGVSNVIDAALLKLKERYLKVETVNNIPEIKSAADIDIANLTSAISQLDADIARLAATTQSTTTQEAEKHEKSALLEVLTDAIDTTPYNIENLKIALGRYTPNGASQIRGAYNTSYMTVDDVLSTF